MLMNRFPLEQVARALHCFQTPEVYLSAEEMPPDLAAALPAAWHALLAADTDDEQRATLRKVWAPMERRMRHTLELLDEALRGIGVLRFQGEPRLLYLLSTADGRPVAFGGRLPAEERTLPARIAPVWEIFPPELRALYAGVHDGWTDVCHSLDSFLPVAQWETPEGTDLLDAHGVEADRTWIVARDSGGTGLGFELREEGSPSPILIGKERFSDTVNFWFELEAWIASSLGH